MNFDKLDSLIAERNTYTPEDLITMASKLKPLEEAKFAYSIFWVFHLETVGSSLPTPTSKCDWKLPAYASGIAPWQSICETNGWV